jgi:hypothetical protein
MLEYTQGTCFSDLRTEGSSVSQSQPRAPMFLRGIQDRHDGFDDNDRDIESAGETDVQQDLEDAFALRSDFRNLHILRAHLLEK